MAGHHVRGPVVPAPQGLHRPGLCWTIPTRFASCRKELIMIKVALTIAFCFGTLAAAQQQNAFPQPTAAKEVMVTAIPGVIAAGAKWKLVWQGPDNADGIIGTKDGGLLFAQEQR